MNQGTCTEKERELLEKAVRGERPEKLAVAVNRERVLAAAEKHREFEAAALGLARAQQRYQDAVEALGLSRDNRENYPLASALREIENEALVREGLTPRMPLD